MQISKPLKEVCCRKNSKLETFVWPYTDWDRNLSTTIVYLSTGIVCLSNGQFHLYQKLLLADIIRGMGIGRQKGEQFFSRSVFDLCNYFTASDQRPLQATDSIGAFVLDAFAV